MSDAQRKEAEAVALAMQAALNCINVPAGARVAVVVMIHHHILVAGNEGKPQVGMLLFDAARQFLRDDVIVNMHPAPGKPS